MKLAPRVCLIEVAAPHVRRPGWAGMGLLPRRAFNNTSTAFDIDNTSSDITPSKPS